MVAAWLKEIVKIKLKEEKIVVVELAALNNSYSRPSFGPKRAS